MKKGVFVFAGVHAKRIFIKQNIWLAVIGIILSLPLGYTMIDYIFKSALSDAYFYYFFVICLSIGITFLYI